MFYRTKLNKLTNNYHTQKGFNNKVIVYKMKWQINYNNKLKQNRIYKIK